MSNEKQWEKIQQKTFTKWVNSHLRKRRLAIEDLQKDFGTGVTLIQFLEIISNQTLPKHTKLPKIRIQKIQNVSLCLDFLKAQKIHLVNISAEDIVDENLKLILGLIWTIIQKFAIDDISEEQLSAKEALLLWCQKKTAGYKDVKVENFHYSFQDGLALCALIHRHRPDLLDFNKLSKENKAHNLQLAFDVAERDLGIPKLLDVEDMVDIKPDERSVMTYVSQYYHVFSKYNQAEVAGRRIGKLIDLTETLDAMKNDYGNKAKKLVEWINKTTPQIESRDFDNTLPGARKQIEDFKTYKSDEKPPKAADKSSLEALFNNIALKLRNNSRPPFEPPAGLAPSDIDKLWEKLGGAERARDQALIEELRRQEKLDHLRRRFHLKAGKFEEWLAAKEHYLGTVEDVNSLNEAQTKLKNHDAFDEEYANAKSRLDAIQKLAAEFVALNPLDANEVSSKSEALGSRYGGLAGPQATKRTDLEDKLAKEQQKEALRLEFAKQAKEYNAFAKEASNTINDHNFGDTLESVQAFKSNLDSSDHSTTDTTNTKKAALDDLWNQMTALGVTENRYTPITNKDIEATHNHLLQDLERRRAAYDAELKRQEHMEAKRKEFAEKAKAFADALAARKSNIEQLALTGEPTETIAAVKSTYSDGKPEHEGLATLSALQQELTSLGIRDNKYTTYTLPTLQTTNQFFANSVRNILSSLKDEEELKAQYIAKAQALHDWASQALPTLQERNFDNTLEGARAKNADFQKFSTGEKAQKDNDQINTNSLFNKIANLLNASKRPAFAPPSPLDPASIKSQWDNLNAETKNREDALAAELSRQEKLYGLVKRFNSDAEDLEAWAKSKEAYLSATEEVTDLDSARLKSKNLEVFKAEHSRKNAALDALKALQAEIHALNYHDVSYVDSRSSGLDATWAKFHQLANDKGTHLAQELKKQQELEDLRVQFADAAADFVRYARDAVESASVHHFGYTLEDVTNHKSELDASDASINEKADSLKAKADGFAQELSSRGVTDNRHTTLTTSDVEGQRAKVSEALQKRREAYEAELSRQNVNEGKRKDYAAKANSFINHVDEKRKELSALSGTPEERMSATEALYQGGAATKAQVDELATIDSEMKSLGIYDNKHTPYSLPVVQTRKNQYDTSVNNFLTGLKEEKELNDRAAQLQAEYERSLKLENLKIEYGQAAGQLHLWLENANETVKDPISCATVPDAQDLINTFEQLIAEKPTQEAKLGNLNTLASELTSSFGVNSFQPHSPSDIQARWTAFLSDSDARKQALDAELAKQNHNENLRVQFAEKAKALQAFIQEQSAFVNSNSSADLEDQLKEIQNRKPTIFGGADQLSAVEALHNQLSEAGVTHNPHTDLTYPTLKADFQQLVKETNNKETLIQKEIIQKTGSRVSAEQLAEFREVFDHFDKDRRGSLNRLEFKSCLQSLGEDLADAELDKIIAAIGTDGKVPFDSFCDFMANKSADSESKDQILEAFRALSGDKGFITEDELRRALPAEKVAYLTKAMPLHNGQAGNYDYTAWANKAFS